MAAFIYENCDLTVKDLTEVFKRKANWANPKIKCIDDEYAAEFWCIYKYIIDDPTYDESYSMTDQKLTKFGHFIPNNVMKDLIADFAELSVSEQNRLAIVWLLIIKIKYMEYMQRRKFYTDAFYCNVREMFSDKTICYESFVYIFEHFTEAMLKKVYTNFDREFLAKDVVDNKFEQLLYIIFNT
jgi:hypothetical protein